MEFELAVYNVLVQQFNLYPTGKSSTPRNLIEMERKEKEILPPLMNQDCKKVKGENEKENKLLQK